MRIIAGKYRGKKLFPPLSDAVRPTMDRAREAVFSIINGMIDDWSQTRFLDVFCGTGAFGLEAISRGAAEVCLLDIDPATARKNANLFPNEQDKIKVIKANVMSLPGNISNPFNLIFLDAPYNQGLSEIALQTLIQTNWLSNNALIIVEVEKNEELIFPSPLAGEGRVRGTTAGEITSLQSRTYGAAKFLFFQLKT